MIESNEKLFSFFGKTIPNILGASSLALTTFLELKLEMDSVDRLFGYSLCLIPLGLGEYIRRKHEKDSRKFVKLYNEEYHHTISEFGRDEEGEEWKYNFK